MVIRKADINDIDVLVANRIEFLKDMTQLINIMIQESRERNVGKLYLSASEMGMPVYKKLGFEVLTNEMAYKIL